jgi:pimeloyl-ACP methyl ester carboxylesterase
MSAAQGRESVVLLHGLWLTGWAMTYIAWRLRRGGFRPYLFSYPSVRGSLRDNATALRTFSDAIRGDAVHFVGHSLGGVVIQAMLAYCPPPRAGRVVTLCTPHRGNRAAQNLARRRWGPRMLGASMADLLNGGAPGCDLSARELGIIRGDRSFGVGRLFSRLREPNDGVVLLSEAALPGAADEVTLHASHSGILLSRRAAAQTDHFLRCGRFIK